MTFITAELGINANGSIDIAKKLIDAAKWAGANSVKFQKRTVDIVYDGQLDNPRESPWGATLRDQKYGLEFSRDEYDEINRYCAAIGMPWYASAWDIPSLEFLNEYDLPYNKIASAMLTNLPFMEAISAQSKPCFISTGLSSHEQIVTALQIMRRGNLKYPEDNPITLMHCVGTYPAAESDLNLSSIGTLRARYGLPVGYSGHEASVSPSVIAAALGAVSVERHITLDRAMYGSDQAASLEPIGFKTMVEQIRKLPIIMGDGVKRVTEGEKAVAKKLRYWEK